MEHIHIRNLERYNPGYTDRSLIWCKIYFSMLNSNYEFELIDDVDKWRLIALIMLELQIKKPIPYDEKWLQKKISNHKRPISLTIKMLHNFLEVVTESLKVCNDSVTQSRVDKSRVDKDDKLSNISNDNNYPNITNDNNIQAPTLLNNKEFKDLWNDWLDVRRKIKAPNTDRALSLSLKKLEGWGAKVAIEALKQSIERGYRSVFKPGGQSAKPKYI